MAEDSSIKVAVRIRPQIAREIIDLCRVCTTVVPGEPQITLGTDKSFTYDYVFDVNDDQQTVYEKCAATLVEGSLEGYNATVLAYGQTGSGKTYTMGTGFDVESEPHLIGILPRAINQLFDGIKNITEKAIQNGDPSPAFTIYAQFLELYNEEVIDLFDPSKDFAVTKSKSGIKIHEDSNRSIYLTGVTSKAIHSADEALQCLREGALSRTTASTQMNSHSSRSHAIFTLHIEQKKIVSIQQNGNMEGGLTDDGQEFETLKAKFHFVDLAGSERLKRTMATGDRAKEGISINCGLLALGNVISALGDKSKKAQHVPYRDAKLTRLLQDSLGGNSRTVMIACISPSDRDFMETLNTLKYANRARNIQNKVIVNQDKSSRTIMMLRQEIQELKTALLEYKQGKRVMNEDGEETVNDTYIENMMLQTELSNMRTRMKALQETVDSLTTRNSELLTEREINAWVRNGNTGDEGDKRMEEMIREYLKEIGDLRTKLLESEYTCELLRKQAKTSRQTLMNTSISVYEKEDETMVDNLLAIAKKDLERDKRIVNRRKSFNDDVNGEENSGSDDEDNSQTDEDEEEDNNSVYSQELADITSEINVKQSLIDKLEATQKRLQKMKQDYEDKLHQLQTEIKRTQEERDTVLATFSGKHSQNTDKAKEIKDGYEVKINKLQREVRNLQTAKKEHARLLRSQSYNENQLKTLRSELAEMKRAKVKLFNKMKEEATRHREEQVRHNREIAQLRKETRKNENLIRSLETKNRAKDVVLKRKTEEVSALRKVNRNVGLSDKAAGRFGTVKGNMLAVSPKAAKQKWQLLEKNIAAITINKQAVIGIERNMDRLIEQRNTLNARLKEKNAKLSEIERSYPIDRIQKKELEEEIENIQENMRYVEDSIKEAQENLLDLDEPKLTVGSSDILSSLTNAEASYIMNKLYSLANFYSMQATLKDISCKELQTKLSQIKRESVMHEQLLQHMLERQGLSDNVMADERSSGSESAASSRSTSPMSLATSSSTGDGNQTICMRPGDQIGKVRRRTAMPEELLYDENTKSQQSNEGHAHASNNYAIMKAPSTSSVNKYMVRSEVVKPSPIMSRKTYDRQESTSPRINRRMFNNTSNNLFGKPGSMNLRINDDTFKTIYTNGFIGGDALKRKPVFMTRDRGLDKTPPNSPPAYRRFNSKEENVFSRLTSSTVQPTEQIKTKGTIKEYSGKSNLKAPLICTHIVEGHTKAVLGLHATDYMLFSASKDRTVKIWDLHQGSEMSTLGGHPNNVTSVKFNERDWLIYTVSSAYVKVWDLRLSRCVKTLCSSGTASSMTNSNPAATSQLPFGEPQINDISLSEDNNQLFVAASDKVKIWDIRKYGLIGKLSGGHQAAVMCLAVRKDLNGDNLVITGSKDHYVRLFEVPGHGVGSFSPKVSLDPPHYDGVQALALRDNILFTGSRDFIIKKWDLDRKELVNSLSNAHRDWICGLALVNKQPILLSVCRSGILKLWNTDSCTLIGEMRAHDSSINAIVTNTTLAFTASHNGDIKVWRLPGQPSSVMTMSTGHLYTLDS